MSVDRYPLAEVMPQEPSFSERLGAGLGEGVGEGLEQLAASKAKAMQQRDQMKQLMALGLPPELAGASAEIIKAYQAQQKQQQLQQILGGLGGGQLGAQGGYTDEQLAALTLADPNLGRVLQSQQKEQTRVSEEQAKRQHAIGVKGLEKANEVSQNLPKMDQALLTLENTLDSTGFFSLGNLANFTGIEGLRDPKSAAFISAGKDLFLTNIKGLGPRPNQFGERIITQSLPMVGRSKKANEVVLEGFKAKRDVERLWAETYQEMADNALQTLGYIPANLESQVSKAIKPTVDARYKELEKQLRGKGALEEEVVEVVTPSGEKGSLPKSQLTRWLKGGGKRWKSST